MFVITYKVSTLLLVLSVLSHANILTLIWDVITLGVLIPTTYVSILTCHCVNVDSILMSMLICTMKLHILHEFYVVTCFPLFVD